MHLSMHMILTNYANAQNLAQKLCPQCERGACKRVAHLYGLGDQNSMHQCIFF
jgi:hypothetical protein